MKSMMAVLAAVSVTACAIAQDRDVDDTGPFTDQQADLMSAVWPDIREAAAFEQIDWRTVGLEFAPGDAEARRIMREHWGALRQAANFADIDWDATTAYDRDADGWTRDTGFEERGPFTREEAEILGAVWPSIREAARFDDIDWRTVGLSEAPGDFAAREFVREHWAELRRAADFRQIDWVDVAG